MLLRPVKSHFFVKWLHPRFYEAVASLECFSCENFWTAADFKKAMAKRHSHGYVITDLMTPIGFIVFTRRGLLGRILNLVIHSEYRRDGWGSLLLDRAKQRLLEDGCSQIAVDVRETNLAAQLFLQEKGFIAKAVNQGFFQDHYEDYIEQEDGFHFLWSKP